MISCCMLKLLCWTCLHFLSPKWFFCMLSIVENHRRPPPSGVRNQCRKCFTRRASGSETAFSSWGTWGRARFRGSHTDRFLLCRWLSSDRSPCLERHTSMTDCSVCQRESWRHCADHIFLFFSVSKDEASQFLQCWFYHQKTDWTKTLGNMEILSPALTSC